MAESRSRTGVAPSSPDLGNARRGRRGRPEWRRWWDRRSGRLVVSRAADQTLSKVCGFTGCQQEDRATRAADRTVSMGPIRLGGVERLPAGH